MRGSQGDPDPDLAFAQRHVVGQEPVKPNVGEREGEASQGPTEVGEEALLGDPAVTHPELGLHLGQGDPGIDTCHRGPGRVHKSQGRLRRSDGEEPLGHGALAEGEVDRGRDVVGDARVDKTMPMSIRMTAPSPAMIGVTAISTRC